MTLLAKPSRSYAQVQHNPDGLSSVRNTSFASSNSASGSNLGVGTSSAVGTGSRKLLKKDKEKGDRFEGGFKTYRPPLTETHLRRPLGYDPNPDSRFAPLPPAFHLSSRQNKKDAALAGQRAELDHILQPGYKTSSVHDNDGDSASIAGPSRLGLGLGGNRTAGGLGGGDRKGKIPAALGLRPSASISSFNGPPSAGNSRRSGNMGGVYIDSNGKLHDTEFDPFGNVSEMSRAKSRRRSAFGADRRKGSDSSATSDSGSEAGDQPHPLPRRSTDTGRERDREEEEIRRRLEMERKRLDDVSGYAAARRRSMMSERSGRATPSIRSSEDGPPSIYSANLSFMPNGVSSGNVGRSRSQQGHYIPSPLSPTFGHSPSVYSSATSRTPITPLTHEVKSEGTPPEKTTESTAPVKHRTETKSKVEFSKDGSKKITGFDAPISSAPPYTPAVGHNHLVPPSMPDTGRLSVVSRASSETGRESHRDRPPKPAERPREELFPETPAQIKRREDRERRNGSVAGHAAGAGTAHGSREHGLAVDTVIASSGRGRILPEIEIVEDDDPRIVFPAEGKSTRVQSTHNHVIKGPFSHALEAQGYSSFDPSAGAGGPGSGPGVGGGRRASSAISVGAGSGPSTMFDEEGGYLPSRWASGDRALRVTGDEREKYRPMEWGGKHGDLGGRADHWQPNTKDQLKRNMKDIATSARFSLFRTKKKLLRKAEL